jgi:glutaconate CoA-transferase subunit A
MAASKVVSLEEAARMVDDGASLGIGGVLLRRKPIALLSALASRRSLKLYSFLAGLDVDLLVALGAVAEVHSGYVGFEQFGFAPAYGQALGNDEIVSCEYSELMFTAGLRAACAGLPFMPTRGAQGSTLLDELGWQQITCPYSGETLTAAPALRPDVTVLHADAADEQGNIALPAVRDFLYDSDALIGRSAHRVIATVERIVPTDELRGRGALLYSYEVDAIAVAPRGAWPGALPGHYPTDFNAVRAYLDQAREDPTGAARSLATARASA